VTEKFDVAVLGTGLFGASLTYHLVREPSVRVLAIDTNPEAGRPSATATSAGILSVQGWDPWDLAIVRESSEEYRGLAEEEGVEPLRRNGGLRVARTDAGARWLDRVQRVLEREGTEARRVGAGEIRELLPYADLADVRAGLYTPDDAVMDPAALQAAYLRAAVRAGALLRTEARAAAPEPLHGGGWRIGGESAAVADTLVVAAGAGSKAVLAALGHTLPLAPFRAQAVLLRPRPLLPPFPTLNDLDLNLYVRPASLGRLLAGDGTGSREENPFRWEPNADDAFVEEMRRAVGALFDGLPPSPVEAAWAGLCVASPDRFPLVGRVPGGQGLCVATGFNGFGTMRAAGLARRLADAIRTGRWEPLRPADPSRFPGSFEPFDPRPEFPLESEEAEAGPARDGTEPLPARVSFPATAQDRIRYRLIPGVGEVDGLRWSALSEWFDPFLRLFAKDALRTGGSVEVAEEDGLVRGLFLSGSSEGVGSGFTRTRRVAERYLERMEPGGIYLEEPWRPGGEVVELFAADMRDWESKERVRNPVRIARPDDLPRIRSLMHGELGPGVDPWLATLPRPEETAFLCEIDARVVGVSWLSRVGTFARGHSFLVHPRYRGLGIGSDLLTARMLWLKGSGGRRVVSEIYDGNVASRTAAERAGMALVGRMYHLRPSPRA
jgi:glycine/D-amino acid oxidase-like deaminating enzyme/RimJ/RimL family protein N-acetyltransferase